MRRILHLWGVPLALSVGAMLANGLLPSLAISLYAIAVRDGARIAAFANAVAEPLALLGSAAVTVAVAAASAPAVRPARRWGAILGIAAAAGVAAGSAAAGDLDGWTAATVVLLPASAVVVAGARAARHAPATRAVRAAVSDHRPGSLAAPPPESRDGAPRAAPEPVRRGSDPTR